MYILNTSKSSYGTAWKYKVRLLELAQLQLQDLLRRSTWRISWNLLTRTSYEHHKKTFIQAPLKSIFTIWRAISTRSPQNRLTGPVPDHGLEDFTRTSSRVSVFPWKEAPQDDIEWIPVTDMYMDANPTCRQLDVHDRKGLAPRLAKIVTRRFGTLLKHLMQSLEMASSWVWRRGDFVSCRCSH